MSKQFDSLAKVATEGQEQGFRVLDKLFAVAEPGAVYGEPVSAAGRTVISASEVMVGMGVGFGFGGGSAPGDGPGTDEDDAGAGEGAGGGGGGGGGASGRPVAVISVSDEGVQVQPVVDVTKIAIAFFTAWGSMLFMLMKMRRGVDG